MPSNNDIEFDLELALDNWDKQLKLATSQMNSFHKNWRTQNKKTSAAMSSFVGNLAAMGVSKVVDGLGQMTGAMIDFGQASLQVAIDAGETASKFNVVFKDVAREANVMAQKLGDSYGMARSEAKTLLSDTGDLLTGFGFTGKAALDMSVQVQKLAVDLASFSNIQGGAARSSTLITKALLGEREGIKLLGKSVQEKDVIQQVAINKAQGMRFETERQAKAQATLDLIIKQSTNAIGDYARTQHQVANQQRLFNSRIMDLQENIGGKLIPVIGPAIQMVNKWLKANEEFIAQGFSDALVIIIEKIQGIVKHTNTVIGAFRMMWNVGDTIVQGLITGFWTIETAIAGVTHGIVSLIDKIPAAFLPEGWKENITMLKEATGETLDEFAAKVVESSAEVNESLASVGTSFQEVVSDETVEKLTANLETIKTNIIKHNIDIVKIKKTSDKNDKKDKKVEVTKNRQHFNALFSLDKQWVTSKAQLDRVSTKDRVQNTKDTLNTISTLTASNNKTLFMIGKASSLATATMEGFSAVQKALSSAPPPFNFVLAGLVGVASAANIAKIASSKPPEAKKFATGGPVNYGTEVGDTTMAAVNKHELINSPRMNANLLNRIANTDGGGGGDTGGILAALEALGDRIAGMEMVVMANDVEIARSASRGVQDGIIMGESR